MKIGEKSLNMLVISIIEELRKDGKRGHIDLNGKVTTPLIYDDAGCFDGGRARVRKENITN